MLESRTATIATLLPARTSRSNNVSHFRTGFSYFLMPWTAGGWSVNMVEKHTGVAASAVPQSVVALISALRFHDLGTQLPHQVWIAIPRGTRVPRLQAAPLRVINIAPALFDLGVEVHRIEGEAVKVYSVARTVADCFRFRNTVGLDVALEALSEAWRGKRLNLDELNRIAKRLRVQRVMQSYLETVVL
jgi:predicted transcriptional regulator of viral defense system